MAHQQQHEKSDLGFLRPVKTANCCLKRKKKKEKKGKKRRKNTPHDRLTDTDTDPDTATTEREIILNNKMIRVADLHSCQPLWGENLNPEFVNLFPLCRLGSFVFLLVAAAFSIPTGRCVSGRKKQCCAKYTHATSNLISDEIS